MDGSSPYEPRLDAATLGWLTRALRQLVPHLRCHVFCSSEVSRTRNRVLALKSEHAELAFVTQTALARRSEGLL